MLWLFSISTWALLGFLCVFIALIAKDRKGTSSSHKIAPGPRQWPIIGSIHFMARFTDACKAFSALAKEHGEVVTLRLGSVDTVVISGLDKIRQVLVTRAHLFDARPNFSRYHMLFQHKDNSIAFADHNDLLKKRRDIIAHHSFPRPSTAYFDEFDSIATENVMEFLDTIMPQIQNAEKNVFTIKPQLAELICKIFMKYFCSTDVDYNDPEFKKYVNDMEMIFEEINKGCIGDIFPTLMPFINKSHLVDASHEIRAFVVKNILTPRLALMKSKEEAEKFSTDENNNACNPVVPDDLLNSYLKNVDDSEGGLTVDLSLYALEDLIGGHAAVSNSFIRILYLVAKEPKVQQKIREEIQNNSSGFMKLGYKLPYTEAVLWEAMRHISSPIVPHQTTEDTFVDDYFVKKGTVVFVNNYDLHFSTDYWKDPQEFNPDRFLTSDNKVLKPEHFFPFSSGRRACLGYKIALYMSTILLGNLCVSYDIELDPTEDYTMPQGNISVPGVGKRFIYRPIES